MAHWAQVDDNNIVIQILVGDNDDPNGDEGYQWMVDTHGGRWIKTSYNTHQNRHRLDGIPFRKNFAQIGYFWDEEKDAFYQKTPPFSNWVWDEERFIWIPPIPCPDENIPHIWDQEKNEWVEVHPRFVSK